MAQPLHKHFKRTDSAHNTHDANIANKRLKATLGTISLRKQKCSER